MPTRTATPQRPRRGPLRSPLAAAPHSPLPPPRLAVDTERAASPAVPEPRSLTLAEFRDYLRTVNSRDGRPYEDATINAYLYPAKALDAWMTEKGLDSQHRVEPVLRVDQDRVARPDVRSLLTLVQVGPSGEHRRQACRHGPPA